jgi:LPXTG-motif cell wall-anchored protein
VGGLLITDPLNVTVASLDEASRYAPAAATTPETPTTTTPETPASDLPATGVSAGVAIGALMLMLGALGVRRLRKSPTTTE